VRLEHLAWFEMCLEQADERIARTFLDVEEYQGLVLQRDSNFTHPCAGSSFRPSRAQLRRPENNVADHARLDAVARIRLVSIPVS